jgi:hypothetical protein
MKAISNLKWWKWHEAIFKVLRHHLPDMDH